MSTQCIKVIAGEDKEPVDVPTEDDGTILLETLASVFPGTRGLKYHSKRGRSTVVRVLRVCEGRIYPPQSKGWRAARLYLCSFPPAVMRRYVKVTKGDDSEPVDVPCEDDGTILITTLSSNLPGAFGLMFRNLESGALRGLRVNNGRILPPEAGWSIVDIYIGTYASSIQPLPPVEPRPVAAPEPIQPPPPPPPAPQRRISISFQVDNRSTFINAINWINLYDSQLHARDISLIYNRQ